MTGDLRRSKTMLQIHEVALNPSRFSQPILMYFVLSEVADTVLQEVTSEDVVSLVDNVPEVHRGIAQRGMECPAKGRHDHCGLSFDEERIRLCSSVAPVRVLGSTVINAWVFGNHHLTWESGMITCASLWNLYQIVRT